jgi:acid phosphatase (class A)
MNTILKIAVVGICLMAPVMCSCISCTVSTKAHVYIQTKSLDLTAVLPPPPAKGSKQTSDEIKELLELQRSRTTAQESLAIADQKITVFRFGDVLGASFDSTKLPITAAFFKAALENERAIIDPVKNFWNRPRPYVVDSSIHPCLEKPAIASYPSGHSTAGNFMAILLAAMVPEKKNELFERGWKFAFNRMIGGVHYRSDIEAGRIAATVIAVEFFKNREFMCEYSKARREIRKALGYIN